MNKEHKQNSKKKEPKTTWQKIWYFIWDDDSVWSWIVNIILAFVLIKFIIYPGMGLLLGTTHPVVAVVSGSMEHKIASDGRGNLYLCSTFFEEKQSVDYEFYWKTCGSFYEDKGIGKEQFQEFIFKNGFNTGDIIVLLGKDPEDIKIGDVIVFRGGQTEPIIHRVISKWKDGGKTYFTTKGDHNPNSIEDPRVAETKISEDRLIGKAIFRIPFLGNIKIWFVELLKLLKLDASIGRLFG